MTDVLGAQYRSEEKMAQEGLNTIGYAQAGSDLLRPCRSGPGHGPLQGVPVNDIS